MTSDFKKFCESYTKVSTSDCHGCYNNEYNLGLGGAKRCWSFDPDAELVDRYVVHVDLMPPYQEHNIRRVPPCYKPQCYAVIDPKNIDEDGYCR